jgi:hypothetical protein
MNQRRDTTNQESEWIKGMLRDALPPIEENPMPDRDLWPAMLRRIDQGSRRVAVTVPWFDWALAGGLVALAAIAPRTIPVILYYL